MEGVLPDGRVALTYKWTDLDGVRNLPQGRLIDLNAASLVIIQNAGESSRTEYPVRQTVKDIVNALKSSKIQNLAARQRGGKPSEIVLSVIDKTTGQLLGVVR